MFRLLWEGNQVSFRFQSAGVFETSFHILHTPARLGSFHTQYIKGKIMKIKDKKINKMVSVADIDCPNQKCYWPRLDPGVYTEGFGYRPRPGKQEWVCGTREIRGCPDSIITKSQ